MSDQLMDQVYPALRRVAAQALRQGRRNATLAPTALVHEAWMELVGQRHQDWRSRRHFFAIAARLMHRILLRHEERRRARKRGGGVRLVTLVDVPGSGDVPSVDLILLEGALRKLKDRDPDKHRIVELRFFGGLTVEEIAALEGVSDRTVRRAWSFARSWLAKEMTDR